MMIIKRIRLILKGDVLGTFTRNERSGDMGLTTKSTKEITKNTTQRQ